MPFFSNPAVISAGINLAGGLLGGESSADAARASADAQTRAAQIAAEEARFRPVGVTTRFGSSQFDFDPSGKLSGAGYTLSPDLKAYQDRLMALSGTGLTQAELAANQYAPLTGAATGLFNLGQKYLAQTPEEVAQQYMTRQQDLLAPSRERQMAQLQNQLFQQGRGGLSVGATGARPSGAAGLGATTPEMEAYYNALAQQDAQLATQAQEAGQRQVAFGAGLFGTGADILNQYQTGQVGALDPFKAYLGTSSDIEKLGQQPLQIGSELGGRASTAGARAGEFITQGARNASGYNYQANSYNPFSDVLIGAGTNKDLMRLFGGGTGSGLSIDPYGYGIGSGGMGTVDTSMYGGAFGVPIR
jgi:hypothetical protein